MRTTRDNWKDDQEQLKQQELTLAQDTTHQLFSTYYFDNSSSRSREPCHTKAASEGYFRDVQPMSSSLVTVSSTNHK